MIENPSIADAKTERLLELDAGSASAIWCVPG